MQGHYFNEANANDVTYYSYERETVIGFCGVYCCPADFPLYYTRFDGLQRQISKNV